MFKPNLGFVLLFVKEPLKSTQFYQKALGISPLEQSETFALFALSNGIMLGLWSYKTAQPEVTANPGASEIAFSYDNPDLLCKEWKKQGILIAQEPTQMDFGRTFVALDPDGHRIRIYRLQQG